MYKRGLCVLINFKLHVLIITKTKIKIFINSMKMMGEKKKKNIIIVYIFIIGDVFNTFPSIISVCIFEIKIRRTTYKLYTYTLINANKTCII